MLPTKDQERKALGQIKKILATLGDNMENSYILTAFDGVVEDAEENIENDFACSWRQRAEYAEKAREKAEQDREYFRQEAQRQADYTEKAENELNDARHKVNDLLKVADQAAKKDKEIADLKQEVMFLKAKLYDYMIAEGKAE